jgi:hypothetical protein
LPHNTAPRINAAELNISLGRFPAAAGKINAPAERPNAIINKNLDRWLISPNSRNRCRAVAKSNRRRKQIYSWRAAGEYNKKTLSDLWQRPGH